MGFLQSLFGDPSPPDQEQESEPSINLSEENHEVAHPVVVRQSELDAFKQLIAEEREEPYSETEMPEFLRESIDEGWQELTPGDQNWSEENEQRRQLAEEIIGAWEDEINGESGVVLLPIGAYFKLEKFLWACEARAENEKDPFDLPDTFLDAASLVKRLKAAENDDGIPTVFAHVDDIPVTR